MAPSAAKELRKAARDREEAASLAEGEEQAQLEPEPQRQAIRV